MPPLDTKLHLRMLEAATAGGEVARDGIYGLQWGDPQTLAPLRQVRDRFVLPYVDPDHTAIEIGPGGGRWTRYLLGFGQVYAVDYHQELLDELAHNFRAPNLRPLRNNGTDFPGIPDGSVDFVFAFGVFVHFDVDIIAAYLKSVRRVLKTEGCAVIQYSDKNKEMARNNSSFAETTPEIVRPLVIESGHRILEEDVTTLWHSAIIRFAPSAGE